MHPEHAQLLEGLREGGSKGAAELDRYGGSGHQLLGVSVPARRKLAKAWVAAHRQLPAREVIAVVESLFSGESHEEKTLGALLLGYHAPARAAIAPARISQWLEHLHGWAEVDSLCQNLFTANEVLGRWSSWRTLIERLGRHASIDHRRASLVLLTGPVRRSDDARLGELAFEMIGRLQGERDIVITKAISWLLRSLITHHAGAVERYLAQHAEALPKVAVRETRTKLQTGTKAGRSRVQRR